MSGVYTPGLQVSRFAVVTRERELPLQGKVLVNIGDAVSSTTPVLFAELPGDLSIIRLADRLGMETESITAGLLVKKGDPIRRGDTLCEIKSFFGLFTSKATAPVDGTVEFYTPANAHLGIREPAIPLTVSAYLTGTVTAINPGRGVTIEAKGAFIQGIFGVGGERLGTILPLDVSPTEEVDQESLRRYDSLLRGAAVVGGARFSIKALKYAAEKGAQAVVTGSVDAMTLREFVGRDIGVSITGDEDVPLTLIITEGFGRLPISDRIMTLARKLRGCAASINGATQVRAGAVRPEVIVPQTTEEVSDSPMVENTLEIGSRIRCIRVPHFGIQGTVIRMVSQPQKIDSGAVVRVLEAKLDNGTTAIIPRANVELLT